MLFSGPGIGHGSHIDFLGTQVLPQVDCCLDPQLQVDLAPTILGLAGVEAAPWMDGKSIVPLLVNSPDQANPSVQRHLSQTTTKPFRTASFHEYYNQGPWEVGTTHALDDWSK